MNIVWRTEVGPEGLAVGEAAYDDDYPRDWLSALHQGKRPICVKLPGHVYFCVYSQQITDGKMHEPGWSVSGEPDHLTLTPSINVKGVWHGHITAGVLTPDEPTG